MQTGVEIHLHQGKPGVRAANTHRVVQAFHLWLITEKLSLITQERILERLFEHGPTYTSGPTVRQANVRRGIHKPSTTRRGAPEAPRPLAQARYVLRARIALRRVEERAESFIPLLGTTAAIQSVMREQDTK
jgi:hypothetical protein